MPRVIALCGRRRSGKDTIAEYLVARHGYTHISIAGPLKEAASLLFQLPPEAFETDHKDEVDPAWGCTPRQILQSFGQDMKARFGQEFWMRLCMKRLDAAKCNVVISDVRFPYEADMLRQRSECCVVRVHRERALTEADEHASEVSTLDIVPNVEISNSGTKQLLYEKCEQIIEGTSPSD